MKSKNGNRVIGLTVLRCNLMLRVEREESAWLRALPCPPRWSCGRFPFPLSAGRISIILSDRTGHKRQTHSNAVCAIEQCHWASRPEQRSIRCDDERQGILKRTFDEMGM